MIQGISPTRPLTARTAARTIQSIVPLFWASANSQVMPASVRNNPLGKSAMMSRVVTPATSVPTRNAPTKARTPMLMGNNVAITNIAQSNRMAIR